MRGLNLVLLVVIYVTNAQNEVPSRPTQVSIGLDQFALSLLEQTSTEAGNALNIALSPYTIWTLLAIISEGARENTLRELEKGLGVPSQDKQFFRNDFRRVSDSLRRGADGVSLDITNAIFTTSEFSLNSTFQSISQNTYSVDVVPVDFKNARAAVSTINNYISRATRNRIPNFVNPSDIDQAAIFMTSALFFKGQWRYPFNKTATTLENFYDDAGMVIGRVEMMYQAGPYPYTLVSSLNAFAAELPYGESKKMSMIVIVPRKGETLASVLRLMSQTPISDLIQILQNTEADFPDEDVEVFLPKFSIESELNLNAVLSHLGIRDVFNADRANLLGIFPQYLFLSRVLQKAVIEVDEEGTVATAAAGGAFAYKTTQPKLMANRPFAFLIVDKSTQSILFAGKVSNPRGLCDRCI